MNRRRLLLINPPQTYPVELENEYQSYLPMGLAYLAAIAREEDYDVRILDCLEDETKTQTGSNVCFGKEQSEILNEVKAFSPDIVGISNPFSMFQSDADGVARLIRQYDRSIPIMLGGISSSIRSLAEKVMSTDNYDILVKGEGEYTTRDILSHYIAEQRQIVDLENIKGIWFKKGKKVIENPDRPFILNLDSLPLPALDLFNIDKTLSNRYYSRWRNDPIDKKTLPVFTSRGCPYHCIFCSIHSQVGYKHRSFSNEYVLEYLKQCKEKYGVSHFHFEDDNLTLDYQKSLYLFKSMKKLNITWDTPNGVRADTIDEPLLHAMIESGLIGISMAAESGNNHVLKTIIHKNLKTESVVKVAKLADKFDLPCVVFFVLGFPGETIENIKETILFSRELTNMYGTINTFYVANPLPGTELENIALNNGFIQSDLSETDYLKAIRINQRPILETPQFNKRIIFDTIAKLIPPENYSIHGNSIPMFWSLQTHVMERAKRLYPKINMNKKYVWEWHND